MMNKVGYLGSELSRYGAARAVAALWQQKIMIGLRLSENGRFECAGCSWESR